METGAVLAVFFAAVVWLAALSRFRSRYLPGRALSLLRALFPSWRFFEDLDLVPVLQFRLDGESGPWRPCLASQKRSWSSLLVNARGNLRMACNSLVEQLVSDAQEVGDGDADSFGESVSYLLAVRLVRSRIREMRVSGDLRPSVEGEGDRFQFRVRMARPGEGDTDEGAMGSDNGVVLVSRVHPA